METLPHAFLCPITHEVMKDPVVCALGHVYEREAIEYWLASHDTSPMTNEILPSKVLKPHDFLRDSIEKWELTLIQRDVHVLRMQKQKEEAKKMSLRVQTLLLRVQDEETKKKLHFMREFFSILTYSDLSMQAIELFGHLGTTMLAELHDPAHPVL